MSVSLDRLASSDIVRISTKDCLHPVSEPPRGLFPRLGTLLGRFGASEGPQQNPSESLVRTQSSCTLPVSHLVCRSLSLSITQSVGRSVCLSMCLSVPRCPNHSACRSLCLSVTRSVAQSESVSRSVAQSVS